MRPGTEHRGRQRVGDLVLDDLRRLAGASVRMMTCVSSGSGSASTGVAAHRPTPNHQKPRASSTRTRLATDQRISASGACRRVVIPTAALGTQAVGDA